MIEQQSLILTTSSQTFADLTSIAQTFAGEQSGIYAAMFVASKAFAIADGLLKIQQGMANALSLPFPANLGAMAAVAAAGASIASNMNAISMQSFDGGGYTGTGDRVGGVDGKGGFPALLHPNEVVTDLTRNKGMSGNSGGPSVVVHNYVGGEVEQRTSPDGKTIEVIIKRTKNEIATDINRGQGSINKALDVRDKRTRPRR